ncbi:ABC transporter permease subunit [Sessilibacter corallicola]|uniref:ABC transporter permease subunit n=1 Tax=Sessilibacter corallicola TaxID=2904075 RepID=UPI001E4DEEC3|nr:ABC transporter permease subunit [Sessilibacter corallicola]MCE2027610.1 ABC transporter permease subunit [Sessilibacter corallicola]
MTSSVSKLNKIFLAIGFFFLYVPMIVLIVYSFNGSERVNVWAGFSFKWYGELFRDEAIMSAVWVSVKLAFASASAAVVMGTLASLVLTRAGKFKGKTVFGGMVTAPLVMPEVITGLSLLLLFVGLANSIGWPEQRGFITIWIAHVTFCMAYVTVVVSSRLTEMDRSLEEAAMDLGATPLKTFLLITLPIISPALISGWLLAFTLSLDDLVIASFVSGPSSTTLPMIVFSSVRLGLSPKINALATIMILTVLIAAVISYWLVARNEKRQRKLSEISH